MAKCSDFKIGVVEDNVQSAISLSNQLAFEGFNTFQSYSGTDSVTKCKKEKPDVLILDLNVDRGGLNGYQVAEALPDQKILYMSTTPLEKKKVLNAKRVIGLVEKPIDFDEVLKILKKELKIN